MIKLKHLLTERLNWVSKKRARAELRQKISGQRNDGMGAYTGKIFGIGYKPKNNQDYSGPRTEITSMEELDSGKYMIFALGDASMPDIGDDGSAIEPGDALVFKMPRKRLGLFAAPANREYIEYDIEYKDDKQDDEGKPETVYVTVDAEYTEAAKKILDYMAADVYELVTGNDNDMSFDTIVDVPALLKVNDIDDRDDEQMFTDEEEIEIPLKKPLNGKNVYYAEADVFDGGTSFRLDQELVDALESANIDEYDFKESLEEALFGL